MNVTASRKREQASQQAGDAAGVILSGLSCRDGIGRGSVRGDLAGVVMLRVLALLLALCCAAHSEESGPRESKDKAETAQGDNQHGDTPKQIIVPANTSSPTIINIIAGKHSSHERDCTQPKDWKQWPGFAWCKTDDWLDAERTIAIFTVVLAIATGFLWWATRRLVHGAEETAQRQLRAYLNMEFGAVLLNSPTEDSATAWLRIKNLGATPAYNARAWLRFSIGPTNTKPFDQAGKSENETSLGPTGEFNLMSTLSFSSNQLQVVRNKTFSVFMWGRLDYIDAFKKPRYLTFKGLMNGDPGTIIIDGDKALGWGFSPTAEGNEEN
jgi:hypothetical protein